MVGLQTRLNVALRTLIPPEGPASLQRLRSPLRHLPDPNRAEAVIPAGPLSVATPRSLVSRGLTASLLHRLERHRAEGEKPLKRLMPTRGRYTGVRPVLIRPRDRRAR